MTRLALATLTLCVGSFCACGPSTNDDDSTATVADDSATVGDDGPTTGAGDSVSATGVDSNDASGTGVDSNDSGDDGDPCSPFGGVDGAEIMMQVVNRSAQPIFVQRNGCADPITLSGPEGAGPTQIEFPDCQFPSCDNLLDGSCAVACAGGGGACQQTVVRVDPGASHTRIWTGSVWQDTAVPAQCAPDDCALDCHQRLEAAAGTYALSIMYSGCPNEDPASCECPAGEATCDIVVDDGAPSPMPASAMTEFAYPAETAPQIVIQ